MQKSIIFIPHETHLATRNTNWTANFLEAGSPHQSKRWTVAVKRNIEAFSRTCLPVVCKLVLPTTWAGWSVVFPVIIEKCIRLLVFDLLSIVSRVIRGRVDQERRSSQDGGS